MNVAGGELDWIAVLNDSQFQAGLNRMDRNINRTSQNIQNQGNQIEAFANKAAAAAAAFFSVQAAENFVSSLVSVRNQFQQLEIAFSTMLKSKAKADVLMKELITFASTTPFGLKDAAGAAKQLLAYGSTAKTVVGELRMLGDVASGVSVPIGELVYLYGTLKTQGRAYAMDIRQFAGRGIPIYAELAKVLRVGKDEVAGLVEAGKVGFPQVEQAFKNMTATTGMFGSLMEAQSKSLGGLIERFKDAWDIMLNDMGKSQEGFIGHVISGATEVVENYQQVLDILGLMIYAYGSYRAALIAYSVANSFATASIVTHGLAVRQLTVMETLLAASKRILISLQATYNAVLAASPIGATIALLASLGAVIYSLSQYTSAAEATQERFNKIQSEGALSSAKEANSVKNLVDVIKSHTATNEQREAAYKKLQESTKGVLLGFSQEEIAAGKAKGAIDAYVQSIKDAAVARTAFNEFQKLNDQMAELDVNGAKSISMMDKVALRAKALGTYMRLGAATSFPGANNPMIGVPEDVKKQYKESQRIVMGTGGSDVLVSQTKEKLQKELDALSKKFGSQITGELTKGGDEDTTVVASKKRSVDAIDAEIKKLKEEQNAVSETSAQYGKYAAQITKLEAEKTRITGKASATIKTEESAIKRQAEMLQKIYQLNEKYNDKSLTGDEQKLAQIRGEFKALQYDIDIYNKDSKNKKVNPNLKPQLEKAIENQEYENETERLKVSLDQQKQLYEEYENYKTSIGKEAADIRFKNEINTSLSLLQSLEADRAKLLDKDPTQMSGPEIERLQDIDKRINIEVNAERQKLSDLLVEYQTYNEKKKVLTEKYKADLKSLDGNPSAQTERTTRYQDDLKALEDTNLKKWDSYKALFDNLEILSREQVIQRTNDLKNQIDTGLLAGNITLEQAKKIRNEINNIGKTKGDGAGLELVIQRLQTVASEISGINSEIGSIVGSLTSAAANYISIAKDVKTMNSATASDDEKIAAKVGLYSQAANGLLSMITGITNAAAERKRVTEEFYRSAIDFQNQYNLSLIEQARLDSINKRGIFSKDSLAEIKDGLKASGMAMTEYQKKIDDLYKGQAKVGLRNAVDWKSTGSMVAGGVGTGAAIGSIVPGIGTAVGAVVGGIVGLIGGLFGTKKKKDTYAGLLTEFPELIEKSADGTRKLKTALAEQLIAQNQVNDATKAYLQAAIDAEKELDKAREQVNEGIKTLVGSIDDDLRNALVEAFKAGEDGMKAFENTVGKSMENIISNLAFQAIFNDAFKELEGNMKESFGLGGDSNIVDDLQAFYTLYGSLTKDFDAALVAASEEAKKAGIDIFGKTPDANKSPNSLVGAYSTAPRESIDLLAGQTAGMRLAQIETNEILKPIGMSVIELVNMAKLNHDVAIRNEQNTLRTANNTDALSDIKMSLSSIDRKMSSSGNATQAAGYN